MEELHTAQTAFAKLVFRLAYIHGIDLESLFSSYKVLLVVSAETLRNTEHMELVEAAKDDIDAVVSADGIVDLIKKNLAEEMEFEKQVQKLTILLMLKTAITASTPDVLKGAVVSIVSGLATQIPEVAPYTSVLPEALLPPLQVLFDHPYHLADPVYMRYRHEFLSAIAKLEGQPEPALEDDTAVVMPRMRLEIAEKRKFMNVPGGPQYQDLADAAEAALDRIEKNGDEDLSKKFE
jgi:hypothetical protein